MNIHIFPSENGDFAPPRLRSIDDINQIRLNRVIIANDAGNIELELHLVDFIVNLSNLLNSHMDGGREKIEELMSFSGDMFSGYYESDELIVFLLWDVRLKNYKVFKCNTNDAVIIHNKFIEYINNIVKICGGDWKSIEDLHKIRIDRTI